MRGEERRKDILERLQGSVSPISADSLAKIYAVTRQIIVADIALLRAGGAAIRAEHKGYVLEKNDPAELRRVVVKHDKEAVKEELYVIVDNGGEILDVVVEHPIYGDISVRLNITSRFEVDEFVKKVEDTGANPLSFLTEGMHVHTIKVPDERAFDRMVNALKELNILIEFE